MVENHRGSITQNVRDLELSRAGDRSKCKFEVSQDVTPHTHSHRTAHNYAAIQGSIEFRGRAVDTPRAIMRRLLRACVTPIGRACTMQTAVIP
ncbi:hypothetical protein EVAR_75922_1 [Eumeta japonica]|uniref:Uncharacterized protein n=1 Tax=Eumeta variegata TaxID=151549 RepID=A0A4C1UWQ2_EUMVA|nr:hypothetical protein EVAR_75922_1 [Eumeta japonica]